MPRARELPPNPSGVHLLTARRTIDRLVRSAHVGPGDLVIDFGAGPGTITAPLAATGARVLAVERDARFAERLRARFAAHPVRVVHADLRRVPLPRGPFSVVASIPFAVGTALLRRLLGAPGSRGRPPVRAELVVSWGFARRITEPCPDRVETAWWAARFELAIRGRIPAGEFAPAPSVDAAHLMVRPAGPSLDRAGERALWALLSAVHREPGAPAHRVLRRLGAGRHVGLLGLDAGIAAGRVPARRWAAVAGAAAGQV